MKKFKCAFCWKKYARLGVWSRRHMDKKHFGRKPQFIKLLRNF